MILRRLASILPRQSVRSAICLSISSDGFIDVAHHAEGVLCLNIDIEVLHCYGQFLEGNGRRQPKTDAAPAEGRRETSTGRENRRRSRPASGQGRCTPCTC